MTLEQSLNGLGSAFAALFRGQPDQFVPNLVVGFPAIGIFLIIYGFFMVVGLMTLFKGEGRSKYAHYMGIGLGLLGTSNNDVFNFIEGFIGGGLLIVALGIFGVYAGIAVWRNGHKTSLDLSTETKQSAKANLEAEKYRKEAEHETGLQEKFLKNEDRDIKAIDATLENLDRYAKNGIDLLQHIQVALRKVISLQSQGQNTTAHKEKVYAYCKASVPALVHPMADLEASIQKNMKHLDQHERKAGKIEGELEHETARILKNLEETHDPKMVAGEEHRIKELVAKMHATEAKKRQLIAQDEELARPSHLPDKKVLESEKDGLLKTLHEGNISSALQHLSRLMEMFTQIDHDVTELEAHDKELHQVVRQMAQEDQEYESILRTLKKSAGKNL
jgi:hypothetical protein